MLEAPDSDFNNLLDKTVLNGGIGGIENWEIGTLVHNNMNISVHQCQN